MSRTLILGANPRISKMTIAPLRQRMIDVMVLRGFAARTQETQLSAVGLLARQQPAGLRHRLGP